MTLLRTTLAEIQHDIFDGEPRSGCTSGRAQPGVAVPSNEAIRLALVEGAETTEAEPAPTPAQADDPKPNAAVPPSNGRGAATATAVRPAPARPTPDVLPPWRVILHNDDHNDMDHVVESIIRVIRLNRPSATRCTIEAHRKGLSQLVATHRERAEFLAEQLQSCRLTVTIEPVR